MPFPSVLRFHQHESGHFPFPEADSDFGFQNGYFYSLLYILELSFLGPRTHRGKVGLRKHFLGGDDEW
jgi:hypothetical protein